MTKNEFINKLKNRLKPLEMELTIIGFSESYFCFRNEAKKKVNIRIWTRIPKEISPQVFRIQKTVGFNEEVDLEDVMKECINHFKSYQKQ